MKERMDMISVEGVKGSLHRRGGGVGVRFWLHGKSFFLFSTTFHCLVDNFQLYAAFENSLTVSDGLKIPFFGFQPTPFSDFLHSFF